MLQKIRFYLTLLKLYMFNSDFRESLYSILIYKWKYDEKNSVVFYDLYALHNQFTQPVIDSLEKELPDSVTLFVGEKRHPSYRKKYIKNIFYVDRKYHYLFRILTNKLFITAASHIGMGAKPKESKMVHLFHSLVSIHYVYSENAFDAYDIFLTAGPHHIEELERTAKIRKWKNKQFLKTGYPKLDLFAKINSKRDNKIKIILLAPSWMQYNLLKLHGIEIIKKVLELNFKIIVRPHPHSFIENADIIEKIKEISSKNSFCILEDSNTNGMDSFLKADAMISDWSGAAYEYAFGLLKPVLFIDTPPKFDNNYAQKEFLPMENVCRRRVGYVSSMENFDEILKKIINEDSQWKRKIEKVRPDYLYNFGIASQKAAEEILKISKEM